jgi:hypothetical protein
LSLQCEISVCFFFHFNRLFSSLEFILFKDTIMASSAKRRLAALSEQLVAPIGDQGKFEDIPILKKIAADSNGPRVKGKVVIVTGQYESS